MSTLKGLVSSPLLRVLRKPMGTRSIVGGYNLDANALNSAVAGPYGKVPRKVKKLADDELQEIKLDDGSVKGVDMHGYYSRSNREGLYKESFAFQEWDEVKTVVDKEFLGERDARWAALKEAKAVNLEKHWREHMKLNSEAHVAKEKKGFPESFHPGPGVRGALLSRSEMNHIPDRAAIPDGKGWERTSEAPLRELEHAPRYKE